MIGAIIGDMVGAPFEFDTIKTKDFPFVNKRTGFTDDTVMTIAVITYFFKFQLRFSFARYSMDKIRKNLSKAKLFFIITGCFS